MSECPTHEILERWLDETLDSATADVVARHVSECSSCQRRLDSLTVLGADATHESRVQQLSSVNDESDIREVNASLASLMSKLREHPPEDWTLADVSASDSRVVFDGPISDDAPLGRLGSYRIQHELGSGVTGQVFKAIDSRLDRSVAVKVLRPQLASQPLARARFEREARSVAAIDDQYIVRVIEVGETHTGLPFIVMEFVAGESLDARLKREHQLAPTAAAEIAHQIGLGLEAAHRQQIVHRDIKPSNVLLDVASGRAKIVDFGLARVVESSELLTQEGLIAGTPAYMSPEQIQRPQDADARSDVYSLGIVLYEMLTGERPFRGVMRMVLFQVLHEEPISPRLLNDRIPHDLETICCKAMSREPSRRYGSAANFVADLQRFLTGQPVHARPLSTLGRGWRWCRRKPKLALLNAIVAIVLAAGAVDLVGSLIPANSLRQEVRLARQHAERLKHQSAKQRQSVEQLAQLLIFDAQDAIGDQPKTIPSRRALLKAALQSLTDGETAEDDAVRQSVAVAHNRLGDLCRQENDWPAAEVEYRAALRTIETAAANHSAERSLLSAETLANFGEVSIRLQRFDEALTILDRAKHAAPKLPEVKGTKVEDHFSRALLREECLELMARCEFLLLEASRQSGAESQRVLEIRRNRIGVLNTLALEGVHRAKWQRELGVDLLKLADQEWSLELKEPALRDARRGWETLIAVWGDGAPTNLPDRIAGAGQLTNYLIESELFAEAQPILEQALAWNQSLLKQPTVEWSDHKSYIQLERNLALVEFQRGLAESAKKRLASLQSSLSELEADRRFAQEPDLAVWIETQRRAVHSLNRDR